MLDKKEVLQSAISNLKSITNSLETLLEEPVEPAKAEETSTDSKPITLEAVRAVLTELSRAGRTAEVRGLLIKHGAEKLSEIDPQKYPALFADAQELNNAAK